MPRVALVGAFVRSARSVILLTLLACGDDSPIGPPDPIPPIATPIAVGDTVVASFTALDTLALFTISPPEPLEFAVFIQAELGEFGLTVLDSTTGASLTSASAGEDSEPGHLHHRRTDIVRTEPGDIVLLQVRPFSTGRPGRVRLWCYRVNRAPEKLPEGIGVEVILQGEDLENSADIDEFTLRGAAGEEWILFVQGLGGVIPGTLVASVYPPTQEESIDAAVAAVTGVELENHSSGRFVLPVEGRYRIEVGQRGTQGAGVTTGVGGFRVSIRRIDRRPEDVPELLAPGDTLQGEAVDFVGDVDEFEVPLVADSVYNLFLHKAPSVNPASVRATISSGGQVLEITSSTGDTALAAKFTGNFTAMATGNATVRVAGWDDDSGLHRGAYRLFVYPVNRAPETTGQDIAAGDSVVETIEYPGDIDQFHLSPPSGGAVNLVLQRFDALEDWLQLRWEWNGNASVMSCFVFPGQTGARCGSGRIESAAALDLTVASELEATNRFRGEYHLVAAAIDLAPEGRPATMSLGEIVNEEIAPPGDADTYLLSYSDGDLIELEGSGGGGFSNNGFGVAFFDAGGNFLPGYADMLPVSSGRFTLPSSGTYRLVIAGRSGGTEGTETGPYTFTLRRFNSAAEVVSGPIAIGDSVTAEPIGQVGDVDDLVLAGPPGAEVQVFVRGSFSLRVDAIVPGTSTLVRAGRNFATGRVTLPGSGRIGLRVYEGRTFSGALSSHGMSYVGPYAIALHGIDRSPETVDASLTLGTVVEAEAVDFEGDVDEYTFTGTAGQTINAMVSVPMAGFLPALRLQVIDLSTDDVLGSAESFDATEAVTGPIVLPATRPYLVRVQGTDDTQGRGGYRVRLD